MDVGTIDMGNKEDAFLATVNASADAVSSTGSLRVANLALYKSLVHLK